MPSVDRGQGAFQMRVRVLSLAVFANTFTSSDRFHTRRDLCKPSSATELPCILLKCTCTCMCVHVYNYTMHASDPIYAHAHACNVHLYMYVQVYTVVYTCTCN